MGATARSLPRPLAHPAAKVQTRGRLTLPADVRHALKVQPGDEVYFVQISPGHIEVRVRPRRAALLSAGRADAARRRAEQLDLGI